MLHGLVCWPIFPDFDCALSRASRTLAPSINSAARPARSRRQILRFGARITECAHRCETGTVPRADLTC